MNPETAYDYRQAEHDARDDHTWGARRVGDRWISETELPDEDDER